MTIHFSRSASNSTARHSAGGMITWIIFIVALIAFGWSLTNYLKTSHQIAVLTDPTLASQVNEQETKVLLEKIGKLIELPKEKDPVVATINDAESLATTQDFYTNAHNGDRLVIYRASKKAIIYDEQNDKIVNVGPIYYTDPAAETANTNQPDKLSIEVRNGTGNSGAAADLRNRLQSRDAYIVSKLGKATNENYASTIIVDTTNGAKTDLINELAKYLGGAQVVTVAPEGEAPARSEVLVIVGAK